MDEESAEHDEPHQVMEEIADPCRGASEVLREPEEDPRNEKYCSGGYHYPEPHFLSAVELADVVRLRLVGFGDVVSGMAEPFTILLRPPHPVAPADPLENHRNRKRQSEPRMQQTRSRSAAEKWSEPSIEPGREECKSGKERQNEREGNPPMHQSRVCGVAHEFAFVNYGSAKAGSTLHAMNVLSRRHVLPSLVR